MERLGLGRAVRFVVALERKTFFVKLEKIGQIPNVRVEAQRTVGRNKTRSPLSMEPSVTARQEFEIQNGYYACGINGCILAERHTGVCVMPELPNQTRVCVVVGCTTTVF